MRNETSSMRLIILTWASWNLDNTMTLWVLPFTSVFRKIEILEQVDAWLIGWIQFCFSPSSGITCSERQSHARLYFLGRWRFTMIASCGVITKASMPTTAQLGLILLKPSYPPTGAPHFPRSVLVWRLTRNWISFPSIGHRTLSMHLSLTVSIAILCWAVTSGRNL